MNCLLRMPFFYEFRKYPVHGNVNLSICNDSEIRDKAFSGFHYVLSMTTINTCVALYTLSME